MKKRFEMRVTKASKRAWKKAAKAEGLSLAEWMTAAANAAIEEEDTRLWLQRQLPEDGKTKGPRFDAEKWEKINAVNINILRRN